MPATTSSRNGAMTRVIVTLTRQADGGLGTPTGCFPVRTAATENDAGLLADAPYEGAERTRWAR